jgi:hypothetical protein
MIMYNVCFDRPINTNNPARYVQQRFNAMQMQRNGTRKEDEGGNGLQPITLMETDMNAKMQVYMLMKMQSTLVDQYASMRTRGWLLTERVGRSLIRQPRRRKRFTLRLEWID